MSQLGSTDLKRLHRKWKRTDPPRVALILESVASPWNVGAITRTAAAFGIERVLQCGDSAAPRSPRTQKTALGTDRYLQWSSHDDVRAAIDDARADGFTVVAVELASQAQPLHTVDLTGPVALLLGHEDRGVSALALELCDVIGYLPQVGKVGSLNVATAASIAMYEVRRQHWVVSGVPD